MLKEKAAKGSQLIKFNPHGVHDKLESLTDQNYWLSALWCASIISVSGHLRTAVTNDMRYGKKVKAAFKTTLTLYPGGASMRHLSRSQALPRQLLQEFRQQLLACARRVRPNQLRVAPTLWRWLRHLGIGHKRMHK